MTSNDGPVLALHLEQPASLDDVSKWAAIAESLGVPTSSPVTIPVPYTGLCVRAYLDTLPSPDQDDATDDDEAS